VTTNRIYDYAVTHERFDLTYLIFSIFPVLDPLLLTLDSIGHFITRGTLTFSFQIDPITNMTVAVPIFDGTGDFGLVGYIWTQFIAADYTYTCASRRMTLHLGLVLFLAFSVIAGIVLTLTVGAVSQGLLVLIFSIYLFILPYLFFIVVYNYPAQNLFWLPFPLTPMCAIDDATELLICNVLPKCPAIWSGLTEGPYREDNCGGCPMTIKFTHCKYNFGMADAIDVSVAFFRVIWPQALTFAEMIIQWIPLVNDAVINRLTEFDHLDLSDKKTFDQTVECIATIGPASIPTLVLLGTFATVIVLSIGFVLFAVLTRLFVFFISLASLMYFLYMTMFIGFVFVTPPGEIYAFQDELYKSLGVGGDDGRKERRPRPASNSRAAPVQSSASLLERSKGAVLNLAAKLSPLKLFSSTYQYASRRVDTMGLDYFWQAARGKSDKELRALVGRKARRLGLEPMLTPTHSSQPLTMAYSTYTPELYTSNIGDVVINVDPDWAPGSRLRRRGPPSNAAQFNAVQDFL
jgi:hypothetical protein